MTALILLCAMLLDAAFGEPERIWSRIPHPAVLMGRAVASLDRSLNVGRNLRAKGILCLLTLIGFGALVGVVISELGPVAELLCAAVLLAQRSLVDHVAAVANGLRGSREAGRQAVSMIVGRDTSGMDQSQIARAAIESASENLSDGVIAPAFWFLVAGAPGIVIYKCVNTADSMIGYRNDKYRDFGWAAARFDDLVNLIPARLTALLIAGTTGCRDLRAIAQDAGQHRSPNAGWPEAALARGLDIALSGPRSYDGNLRDFPWVNPNGRRVLNPVDIDDSISILWRAWGGLFVLCALTGFIVT